MQPCLSEATTMPSTFAEDVAHFADAGWAAMEVWLTKLETHLQTHSLADTHKLVKESGMTLAAAAYQGGLLLSQGEARQAHFDHFRRRLELCQALNIPTLLLVADFVEAVDQTSLARAVVSLTQAGQWAEGFGVRLALEFRGRNRFCASLDTAVALIRECGQANVGVNLDVFHYYTGPSKFEDLGLLTADKLFHVQVSDLAGVPRELATEADGVLPGDGDFQLSLLIDWLRRQDYRGWVSLELMNPELWRVPGAQLADIAMSVMTKLLR